MDGLCPPGTCPACDAERKRGGPTFERRVFERLMELVKIRTATAGPAPTPAPQLTRSAAPKTTTPTGPIEKKGQTDMSINENMDFEEQSRNVDIERKGKKLLVPESLPLEAAVIALERKIADEEQTVDISHRIDVSPSEGSVAFFRVLQREYGFVSAVKSKGWFPNPPYFMAIDVAPGEQIQVPWCNVVVPGIEGTLCPDFQILKDQVVFKITGSVKGKDRAKAERVVQLVRKECESASIYKGQAISVSFPEIKDMQGLEDTFPKFQKLNPVSPDDVVFSREFSEQVEVSLYTPIRSTAQCRKHNIPLKRGVLLEGPYGVGKTMTAAATATLCKEHGWTYIYLKDASQLARAYVFAQRYQPAVIFAEDVDQILEGAEERNEGVNAILNALDGIDSKGVEIITVLTTNHIEEITRALLRPGRLDTVLSVRAPDAQAAAEMVRKFAGDLLDPRSDLTECGLVLNGVIPAIIRECVERSKLAALRRPGKLMLRAEDITVTARGMKSHMKLLEEPTEDCRSRAEKAASITAEAIIEAAKISHGKSNGSSTLGAAARQSASADAE